MSRLIKSESVNAASWEAESARFHTRLAKDWRVCPATQHHHNNYQIACHDCMAKTCTRMQARGLTDNGTALPPRDRPDCEAHTRNGGRCKNKIIPGKRRCAYHGGKSTGPRTCEGKARIAEAQRKRWAKWRAGKANV